MSIQSLYIVLQGELPVIQHSKENANPYLQLCLFYEDTIIIDEAVTTRCVNLLQQVPAATGGMIWYNFYLPPTSIFYDATGTVLTASVIEHTNSQLHIPAGATVHFNTNDCQVNSPDNAPITFNNNTASAVSIDLHGSIRFETAVSLDDGALAIRYFAQPKEGAAVIDFNARLLEAGTPAIDAGITFNPANNAQPLRGVYTVASTPLRSSFRTPLGAPLFLSTIPNQSGRVKVYDPVQQNWYYTPTGAWAFTAPKTGVTVKALCGLSGIEFIEQPAPGTITFTPMGAFASYQEKDKQGNRIFLTDTMPGSPYKIFTAWVSFSAAYSGYYAQPESSPLYGIDTTNAGSLHFVDILTVELNKTNPALVFPMMPYHGISSADGTTASAIRNFEQQVLTPCRRNIILSAIPSTTPGPAGLSNAAFKSMFAATGPIGATGGATFICPTGPFHGFTGPVGPTALPIPAVTPQGLLAGFSPHHDQWQTLTLAHSADSSNTLIFTDIQNAMRAALLSNQLFLVISSVEKFNRYEWFSVKFKLTDNSFVELKAAGVPDCVLNPLNQLRNREYFSKMYYTNALKQLLGQKVVDAYGTLLLKYAAGSSLVLGDWVFELAPYYWEEHGAIMIIKFSELSLQELVADTSLWTMGSTFNDSVAQTQTLLQGIIAQAKDKVTTEPDFSYFYYTVVNNQSGPAGGAKSWNGTLFLNATVPVNNLPSQLRGIAPGINTSKFFAHHIGATVSSVKNVTATSIETADTSLFGLIYYDDPGDLVYQGNPYAFKVLSLKVLFFNAQITNFSSQIELLVGELYEELVTLPDGLHGNNIVLNGSYQKHDNQESYLFIEESESNYRSDSKVLDIVSVNKAQFITILDDPNSQQTQQVNTKFILWGSMQFRELPDFDLFSFGQSTADGSSGQLAYSNLAIRMSFNRQTPSQVQFAFDASQISFDMGRSKARTKSLFNRFPLSVSGLIQETSNDQNNNNNNHDIRMMHSLDDLKHFLYPGFTMTALQDSATATTSSPTDLGYMSVLTPLKQSKISAPWFGLVFDVNFGSPGGLAGKLNFTASLIAAWASSADNYQIFTGLKLPGSTGGNPEITIMGPLKLKMDRITMVRTPDEAYMMKFFNIVLSFMGITFPPGGRTNALLFGDPNQHNNSTLGWYAAYKKDDEKKDKANENAATALNRLTTKNS